MWRQYPHLTTKNADFFQIPQKIITGGGAYFQMFGNIQKETFLLWSSKLLSCVSLVNRGKFAKKEGEKPFFDMIQIQNVLSKNGAFDLIQNYGGSFWYLTNIL